MNNKSLLWKITGNRILSTNSSTAATLGALRALCLRGLAVLWLFFGLGLWSYVAMASEWGNKCANSVHARYTMCLISAPSVSVSSTIPSGFLMPLIWPKICDRFIALAKRNPYWFSAAFPSHRISSLFRFSCVWCQTETVCALHCDRNERLHSTLFSVCTGVRVRWCAGGLVCDDK